MLSEIAKTRLSKLVKHVREHVQDEQFSMARFASPCGTPSCMAGWATVFMPETRLRLLPGMAARMVSFSLDHTPEESIAAAFDLNEGQVDVLFFSGYGQTRASTCDRFERFIKEEPG